MEDVVNDSLKVERVVGVLHDVVVVGPFQLEWMRKDVSTFRTTHFAAIRKRQKDVLTFAPPNHLR